MRVAVLAESLESSYRAFVAEHEYALLYHSLEFRNLLRDVVDGEPRYLVALDADDVVRGVMPLFEMEGPLGRVLNSLPFYGSNGGVLAASPAARAALVAELNARASAPGVAASTVIGNPLGNDLLEDLLHEHVDERTCQISCIEATSNHAEALMGRFHHKTRNMVRKARKLGVEVSIDYDAIEDLRIIHEQNLVALGGIAKSKAFFESVRANFKEGDGYCVYAARLRGDTVAALLVLYFGAVVEYYTPAVRREFRETQALSLAIFTAMTDASRDGYKWWNWGGTWASQKSLHLFKSRWGAADHPYFYRTKVNNLAVLESTRNYLLSNYPNYFVVPFGALHGTEGR